METSTKCWWAERQRFAVTYRRIRQTIRSCSLFGTRIIFQSTGEWINEWTCCFHILISIPVGIPITYPRAQSLPITDPEWLSKPAAKDEDVYYSYLPYISIRGVNGCQWKLDVSCSCTEIIWFPPKSTGKLFGVQCAPPPPATTYIC